MKYVLDTNVVSALMRGDVRVIARLQGVSTADVAVPEPALAEIEFGIERLARSRRKEFLRSRAQLVVRGAIREEYERRVEARANRQRPSRVVAEILAALPDPTERRSRSFAVNDRRAVRAHIVDRLRGAR